MRLIFLMVAMVLLLLTAGCGIGPGRSEAPTVHMIEWPGPAQNATERLGVAIQVSAPVAYPGYESARMAYRQETHTLRYFAYNRWGDAPARLVGAALTEALFDSGLFDDVAAPGSRLNASYRLDTDLIRLEQVFDASGSALRLTIRYRLIDQASGQSLGSLHHDITVPSASDDPQGGVAAANLALTESLQDLFVELPGWVDAAQVEHPG